jgi:hypothetical protein
MPTNRSQGIIGRQSASCFLKPSKCLDRVHENTDYVEYMVFPRMLALLKTVWTHADKKRLESISQISYALQYKILGGEKHKMFLDLKNNNVNKKFHEKKDPIISSPIIYWHFGGLLMRDF